MFDICNILLHILFYVCCGLVRYVTKVIKRITFTFLVSKQTALRTDLIPAHKNTTVTRTAFARRVDMLDSSYSMQTILNSLEAVLQIEYAEELRVQDVIDGYCPVCCTAE